MAELSWSGKYAVGVEAIDDEHKELFDAARGLESAVARAKGFRSADPPLHWVPTSRF